MEFAFLLKNFSGAGHFQEPTLSDVEPDGFADPSSVEDQSEEFTALSCEKVHSEILASVNRIRSSILTSRTNFLSSLERDLALYDQKAKDYL